ncbi:MAG: hypothetical protein HQK58_03195, partial [Deltaproteobacteria bacterium]|nr:hypothetical protein [Deltaproteobacteria bacterium]
MIKNPDSLPPKEIKTSKDLDSQSVSIFVSGFAMTYASAYAIIVCGAGFSVMAFTLPIPLGIIGGLVSLFLTSFGAGSFVN